MKYLKMLGLTAIAAAALMAFAGNAVAGSVTVNGAVYTGSLTAESEEKAIPGTKHVVLTGPLGLVVKCNSHVAGNIATHGADPITASGPITSLVFNNCTDGYTVHVKAGGTLEAHTKSAAADGNATLTSTGAEVTITVPTGQPGQYFECGYRTNGTDIGTLTGGVHATLHIEATIPRTHGSALCGASGKWEGSYKVTSPTNLSYH